MVASNHTTFPTETHTINCPICRASITDAPAKYIHRCDVRGPNGKLLSREYVGYYEGEPTCYANDGREAQRQLDEYVYDLLSRTAIETSDALATLSTEAPLLVEPHTCAACGDPSDAAICRTCAETGEYCSCGAAATTVWSLNHFCQPVCDTCGAALPVGSLAPLADRVPAFAAPVAEGWGFAGWQEAA